MSLIEYVSRRKFLVGLFSSCAFVIASFFFDLERIFPAHG